MPLAHHLPAGAAVEVVVRPDDVKLEDAEDGTGNGRILSRQFLGIAYLYRVALPDGRVVECTRSLYRADAYDFVTELRIPEG